MFDFLQDWLIDRRVRSKIRAAGRIAPGHSSYNNQEFNKWANPNSRPLDTRRYNMKEDISDLSGQTLESYVKLMQECIEGSGVAFLKIDIDKEISFPDAQFVLSTKVRKDTTANIHECHIESPSSFGIKLENLNIEKITVVFNKEQQAPIAINNCRVRSIRLLEVDKSVRNSLNIVISKSNIGTMNLFSNCVGNLDVSNCTIMNLSCPPPYADNPFRGSVVLNNVRFPQRNNQTSLIHGSGFQPWANARSYLINLHNLDAAGIMHSVELAIQRRSQRGILYVCNIIYDWLSDCGNYVSRPIRWIALSCVILTLLYFCFDGASLARTDLVH